ncbi:MAG: MATE family efflux transporter [Pleomorphochaeta sp.]|jgi:putative MATE family efflux protein
MQQPINLLDEKQSVIKTILLLAWPSIAEQVLFTFVNYIDTAMVGSLGAVATAAISINSSTIWLVDGLMSALAVGFCVLVAKNIGAKNYERASKTVNQGLLFAILLGFVIFIIMLFIGPRLPVILKADLQIYDDARKYIKWITIAFLFQGVFIMVSGIFRSIGNTKLPFAINIINNLINVVLNYFLIFPSKEISIFNNTFILKRAGLGVEGAAIATLVAFITSTIIILIFLINDKSLKLSLKALNPIKMNWTINKNAALLALPNAFERVSLTLGQIVLTAIVASLGTTALASHYLAIQAESITYLPTYGFAVAATTLVAQAVGASKRELSRKFAKASLLMGTITMSLAGIVLYVFAADLVGFFTNDQAVITAGAQLLKIVAISEPFFGLSMLAFGVFRGAGNTKIPFFVAIIGMWIIRLPLAFFLVNYTKYGLNGAWIAMALDLIARGLISLAIFKRDKYYDIKELF